MRREMMMMGETWAGLGSIVAGIMFASAMFQQYFPRHLRDLIQAYAFHFLNFLNPYIQISFHENTGGRFSRNEAYTAIEAYLGTHSSSQAKRLKADITTNSANLVLNLDNHEEVTDLFKGVKFWWKSQVHTTNRPQPYYGGSDYSEEKRSFKLSFHKRHRDLVRDSYLKHVLEEGKNVVVRNRQRRLYTNNSGGWRGSWTHVAFQHRATFKNLAMDLQKKKEIEEDLFTFSNSKDYYAKIGKAWKRGYLLYGPPGTGKTTMIAAMANLLNYDIYDLELTAVKSNTDLRRLLIETSGKSIIVLEDIDCSLDLTGKRKKEKEKEKKDENDPNRVLPKGKEEGNDVRGSDVTLSGLLNFIDGLWSACGEERIIVFTTNHVDKLDPALIRSGRMDKHIELSYCSFEGFKVLAENYLDIDSHELFDRIRGLLEETQMSPADVAENLMPKTIKGDTKTSLENLLSALEMAKEKAKSPSTKDAEEGKVITEKEGKEEEESVSDDKKVKKMNKDKKSLFSWCRRASSKKRGKVANQSVPEKER
ncbi:AAA-ATPase ASD, mitochondrial-like [Macadamia integrifolia]|uniref:AAA-ATPase ASD, mitochondrial-like n=1 Tax=Macadamia integrifolia TaxID=60698 RepID=UPI001C4EC744|nr:AAA-ATPase ASD, mitochondrial-like [Macadamia integrifolia]